MTTKITEGPALPLAVGGHAGGIVDGRAVVVGGSGWSDDKTKKFWSEASFIFDNGAWSTGPKLPHPLADMAYAADAGKLYLAGGTLGKTATADTFVLDRSDATAAWRPLAPLPAPIEAAAGAIHANTFYVVAGFSEGKASPKLLALDLSNRKARWTERVPLPAPPRAYPAFVAVGNALYLFGGFNSVQTGHIGDTCPGTWVTR